MFSITLILHCLTYSYMETPSTWSNLHSKSRYRCVCVQEVMWLKCDLLFLKDFHYNFRYGYSWDTAHVYFMYVQQLASSSMNGQRTMCSIHYPSAEIKYYMTAGTTTSTLWSQPIIIENYPKLSKFAIEMQFLEAHANLKDFLANSKCYHEWRPVSVDIWTYETAYNASYFQEVCWTEYDDF